jgi:hypothetical protein
MMVLVCSKHNQKDAEANSNRINNMTDLFGYNHKKGKENTLQGILDAFIQAMLVLLALIANCPYYCKLYKYSFVKIVLIELCKYTHIDIQCL